LDGVRLQARAVPLLMDAFRTFLHRAVVGVWQGPALNGQHHQPSCVTPCRERPLPDGSPLQRGPTAPPATLLLDRRWLGAPRRRRRAHINRITRNPHGAEDAISGRDSTGRTASDVRSPFSRSPARRGLAWAQIPDRVPGEPDPRPRPAATSARQLATVHSTSGVLISLVSIAGWGSPVASVTGVHDSLARLLQGSRCA
jgi:hypothetical protein